MRPLNCLQQNRQHVIMFTAFSKKTFSSHFVKLKHTILPISLHLILLLPPSLAQTLFLLCCKVETESLYNGLFQFYQLNGY